MANKIDEFWQIFNAVAGTTTTVTESTNAIAKSDRAKVESYFSNVIDQFSFSTNDYNRLRKFLIDLYATFRTQSSVSLASTDPHALSNSDLDELFRSMGYDYSTSLKGTDENPLEQKVQFFLDLVNLYKVKGTPQSLVDVLQYYGVTEVDIYEFFLKKSDPSTLFFDGKAVAGTTVNPSDIAFPYANITSSDPHWLYTAQQILTLDQTNKINLPSKTPYLGVQPTVSLEGSEMAIIERYVQDQYDYYQSTGTVPTQNAEVTYTGESVSLLELYIACVYLFNDLYDQGSTATTRFLCYDGTNTTNITDIMTEFTTLTQSKVSTRDQLRIRNEQYLDIFSRAKSENFLVDENTAGTLLATINPSLKSAIDTSGQQDEVLYSLLKDLALWVRSNIGYGFVNFGFILFGIQEFFNDLKPVIDFFKPYRARLLLLENLQIDNRLFNTIVVEDSMSVGTDLEFHDILTGDSTPCCEQTDSTCGETDITVCSRQLVNPVLDYNWRDFWGTGTSYAVKDAVAVGNGNHYICTVAHTSTAGTKPGYGALWATYWQLMSTMVCSDTTSTISFYARDTFDCGSYFDIGAVTDIKQDPHIYIEETITEHLRCPSSDTTGFVVSEVLDVSYAANYSQQIPTDSSSIVIYFSEYQPDTTYTIAYSIRFDQDANPLETPQYFTSVIIDKDLNGFEILLSNPVPSGNYYIDWALIDSGSTIVDIGAASVSQTILIDSTTSNYVVSGSISNIVDTNPSTYSFSISDKTADSFTVNFSGSIDSANYKFEYIINEISSTTGKVLVTPGSDTISYSYPTAFADDSYQLLTAVETEGEVYLWTVTEKSTTGFTVELSLPADSTNVSIMWHVPETVNTSEIFSLSYYQSGGFRDFDSEGTFDCTHGFDFVQITVEDATTYLLTEDGGYLLQEDGGRILL